MLFGLCYRITDIDPLLKAAIEGIDLLISLPHQNLCRTGTGGFIRSGAVQEQQRIARGIHGII